MSEAAPTERTGVQMTLWLAPTWPMPTGAPRMLAPIASVTGPTGPSRAGSTSEPGRCVA
jgi:hypothetical protein